MKSELKEVKSRRSKKAELPVWFCLGGRRVHFNITLHLKAAMALDCLIATAFIIQLEVRLVQILC